jgi:hypothetical protein
MIAAKLLAWHDCMVQSDHDRIAKFIRWLEDARQAKIAIKKRWC